MLHVSKTPSDTWQAVGPVKGCSPLHCVSYCVREFPTAVRNFVRNYLSKGNPHFRVRGWTKGTCEAQSAPVFPFIS